MCADGQTCTFNRLPLLPKPGEIARQLECNGRFQGARILLWPMPQTGDVSFLKRAREQSPIIFEGKPNFFLIHAVLDCRRDDSCCLISFLATCDEDRAEEAAHLDGATVFAVCPLFFFSSRFCRFAISSPRRSCARAERILIHRVLFFSRSDFHLHIFFGECSIVVGGGAGCTASTVAISIHFQFELMCSFLSLAISAFFLSLSALRWYDLWK